ncbi:CaiB/BaiF CoA transferase family protein [Paraburkholderia sediminicola]|uniref:CaiB/BaiF CoA transferase family protein n=1 Tax=Paraburkholderia sediminicola TaxID=458836 RepID=UPI0038BD5107
MSRFNSFMQGVRVLDVSAYIPGPMAGLLLADMGAQVIKIEPPGGDGMCELGPRDAADVPVLHAAINAGKTICRLDLKSPQGVSTFLHLADQADVVIEGFRPGVMKRLGLDYAVLAERNPRLVYCALTGYGQNSPSAYEAGHDANYLAAAGVLHRNGHPPRYFDPPITDVSGALFATIAILGALHRRNVDGAGCFIDLALADTPMLLQQFALAGFGVSGESPQADETYLNGGAAYYRIYRTRDARHVVLGAVEPKFWQAFCEAAHQPEWLARHRDPLPQKALIGELDAFFATLSAAECMDRFAPADCCVTPVLDLGEAVKTPHHVARHLLRRGPHHDLQVLFPAWIDGVPPAVRGPSKTTADPAFAACFDGHRSTVSY